MMMTRLGLGMVSALVLAGCAAEMGGPVGQYVARDIGGMEAQTLAQRRDADAYVPTTKEAMENLPVDKSHKGEPLDLSGYQVTFNDDFNRMSVTDGAGKGPWYSPVHTDFGASHFVGPRKGKGPVYVKNGKLVIELKQEGGEWISSLVQSVNKDGQGFAQQYGYFEMRAKLPPEAGAWGGLWLHSHPALTGPGTPQTEIDVVEAYGSGDKGHHATVHLWPTKTPKNGEAEKAIKKGVYTMIGEELHGQYHSFGVLLTKQDVVYYYDRKEMFRLPMVPEFHTPMYILIDLALLPKLAHKAVPMRLEVDYARVWERVE